MMEETLVNEKPSQIKDDAELESEQEGDLSVHTDELGVMHVQALCMNCQKNGRTSILMHTVPYFREIILMAFECEHCGYRSNEVQFGGTIQEKGCKLYLEVQSKKDLDRQIIKSDSATITIPSLEFEIPAKTQRGSISTIEGTIMTAVQNLQKHQEERRQIDPETTAKIDNVLSELTMMATGITLPFTIVLDDPAGNSFIENPQAPLADPHMKFEDYYRTEEQDLECGLQPDMSHDVPSQEKKIHPPRNEGLDKLTNAAADDFSRMESTMFPTTCHNCGFPGQVCMCVTDIPHFKEVIIMSFNCEKCGFRSNEIKGGGAMPDYGERITLTVSGSDDSILSRDVLKSDSASVFIPEIELELMAGTLGGVYTTVEGLIDKIATNLREGNPFAVGDSDGGRSKFLTFLDRLVSLKSGTPFTLILEDPLANSFIYTPHGVPENDPLLTVEKYQRTFAENEYLGINDMNTEDFHEHADQQDYSATSKEPILSNKDTHIHGGQAIRPEDYHPNPKAIFQRDTTPLPISKA